MTAEMRRRLTYTPISFLFSALLRARFQSTIVSSENPVCPCCLQGRPLRPVDQALRTRLSFQRKLRRMLVAAAIVAPWR